MHFTKLVVSSSFNDKNRRQAWRSGLVNLLGEQLG
jgi:hypothetical protein